MNFKNVTVTKEEFANVLFASAKVMTLVGLIKEITDLVYDKNQDYGDAWQRYGIFTPLIRINDKILRTETLSDGRQAIIADEGIEETLKDIVGYAVLALMWLNVNTDVKLEKLTAQERFWDLADNADRQAR
jgi:hypothetical protein